MTMTVNTPLAPRAHDGIVADNDPAARPRRRSFTPEYKLVILEAYDRLDEPRANAWPLLSHDLRMARFRPLLRTSADRPS